MALPCKPIPLNLGGEDSPPKFRGRPSENTVKNGFRILLRPLKLGGESSPPKLRGYGLTGYSKEGFSEEVLRRGCPEGAQTAPSASTTP